MSELEDLLADPVWHYLRDVAGEPLEALVRRPVECGARALEVTRATTVRAHVMCELCVIQIGRLQLELEAAEAAERASVALELGCDAALAAAELRSGAAAFTRAYVDVLEALAAQLEALAG